MLQCLTRIVLQIFSPKERVIVLLYHRIAPSTLPFELPAITPEEFENQMRYLQGHSQVISLRVFGDALQNGFDRLPAKQGKPFVVVTFDDGYQDNFDFAFPLLKKYHTPATFFIATGFIENPEMQSVADANMHRHAFLSWNQIQEMVQDPLIEFGAHTVSHPRLTELSAAQTVDEIKNSISTLEQKIGKPVTTFAYPFGTRNDFSRDIVEIMKQSGCTSAFTTVHGMNDVSTNPFLLKRIEAGFSHKRFVERLSFVHSVWYGFVQFVWQRCLKQFVTALRRHFPKQYETLRSLLKL